MMLAHPFINEHIMLDDEQKVNMLVVENQNLFTELIVDISNQINKYKGNFVLSNEHKPI